MDDMDEMVDPLVEAEQERISQETRRLWDTHGVGLEEQFRALFSSVGLELVNVSMVGWGSDICFQVRPSQVGKGVV